MALTLKEIAARLERAEDKDVKRELAARLVTHTIEEHIGINERRRFLSSVAEDLEIEISGEGDEGPLDEEDEDGF